MKTAVVLCLFLFVAAPSIPGQSAAPVADKSKTAQPPKSDALATLEKKLHGEWLGGACLGNYTFQAGGDFKLEHYTPAGIAVAGKWSIRWDALPPTLVLKYKSTDLDGEELAQDDFEYAGKSVELKILELTSDAFVFEFPPSSSASQQDGNRKRTHHRRLPEPM